MLGLGDGLRAESLVELPASCFLGDLFPILTLRVVCQSFSCSERKHLFFAQLNKSYYLDGNGTSGCWRRDQETTFVTFV